MRYLTSIFTILLVCSLAVTSAAPAPRTSAAQHLVTFGGLAEEGPQRRTPVTIPCPGLPGPGQKLRIAWRTDIERMYGLENQSNQYLYWEGYVYSGMDLYTQSVGGVPLTPGAPMGGYSFWSLLLAPGETYEGPAMPGPYVEGGAREVHTWHLNTAPELFLGPTITLWVEPVIYGNLTMGGHAMNYWNSAVHRVGMLELRIVPQ